MSSYPHTTILSTQLRDLLEELPSFAAQIVNEHRNSTGGLILLKVRQSGHDVELDDMEPILKVYLEYTAPSPDYEAFINKHRIMIRAALQREKDSLI